MINNRVLRFIPTFWAGFVSAISFFEAWLKFRAEGVSLETGLRVGKLIFTSLNKVEWFFLLTFWAVLFANKQIRADGLRNHLLPLLLVTLILLIQSVWLLPDLSSRAEKIIQGAVLQPSWNHVFFGTLELTKVSLLVLLALNQRYFYEKKN